MSPSTDEDPHLLRVHPDRLDQQLKTLERLGLRGVALAELVRAEERGAGARLVGLTFDDGYTDFHDEVVPLLCGRGMTATVFVVAGRVGGRSDWDEPSYDLMNAAQVRAVAEAGFEIGSHGLNHVRLAGLPHGTLEAEVVDSRRILEDLVMQPVTSFSYPYGSFDRDAAVAVQAAGYSQACVTRDYSVWGRFTLPRFYVGQRDHPARLMAKLGRHHASRFRRTRDV